MALFGPKAADVPAFDRNRPGLDPKVKAALVGIRWIDEQDQPPVRDVKTHPGTSPIRVRFGTWDDSHFGLWTQISRTTLEGRVPYPFTRVKILPYGYGTMGSILVLVRIFELDELPGPEEIENLAHKIAHDMWEYRDLARNYGKIQ